MFFRFWPQGYDGAPDRDDDERDLQTDRHSDGFHTHAERAGLWQLQLSRQPDELENGRPRSRLCPIILYPTSVDALGPRSEKAKDWRESCDA